MSKENVLTFIPTQTKQFGLTFFVDKNTKIIFIENYYGMSLNELQNLIKDTNLEIEEIISTNGGPTNIHSFYTVVLKLKTDNKQLQKLI